MPTRRRRYQRWSRSLRFEMTSLWLLATKFRSEPAERQIRRQQPAHSASNPSPIGRSRICLFVRLAHQFNRLLFALDIAVTRHGIHFIFSSPKQKSFTVHLNREDEMSAEDETKVATAAQANPRRRGRSAVVRREQRPADDVDPSEGSENLACGHLDRLDACERLRTINSCDQFVFRQFFEVQRADKGRRRATYTGKASAIRNQGETGRATQVS